jgi:hypothetical protein
MILFNPILNSKQITGDFDFTHADITTTADSDIYQDEDGNIKVRSYTGTVQV